jgi:hypothetical protein
MVTRYDIGELSRARKTPQGFLRVDARLTRTGIFEYHNPDGSVRRELRLPEVVFDAETLESFLGAPVTDDHPPVMLDPSNVKQYAKGNIAGEMKRDGEFVRAPLLVTDEALAEKMAAGKVQISCGYQCDLEPTPGEWRGQKYDAVQRNIRGNHVAVVDAGRAGAACAARMDSTGTHIQEKKNVKQLTVNAIKFDVDDTLAQAIEADRAFGDKLDVAAAKTQAEKNAGRADAAEKALEAEKAARIADAAKMPALVAARVALEKTAGGIVGDAVKFDGVSDRDIKAQVVEKVTGEKVAAERSDAYVDGAFDLAVKQAGKVGNPALATLRTAAENAVRSDVKSADTARADMQRRAGEAHTKAIPGAATRS